MIDCQNKTLFGRRRCRFEARYDKSEPIQYGDVKAQGQSLSEILDTMRRITYVRDVRATRGTTIERNKTNIREQTTRPAKRTGRATFRAPQPVLPRPSAGCGASMTRRGARLMPKTSCSTNLNASAK